MKQHQSAICTITLAVLLFTLALAAWIMPAKDFSDSERRKLAQFPEISLENISNGSLMTSFESYTQDQFPLRDTLRSLKAFSTYYVFRQLDNNDIYVADGYAAQLEYPLNEASLDYAVKKFDYIYENYLSESENRIFLSIVPDKSCFLAEENGYLSLDYDELFSIMKEKMDYAEYIDITQTLDISDYYKTDTHWRQEKLGDTAAQLASGMGISLSQEYILQTLDNPFYGVYYGQSSLPLSAETIYYLSNPMLDSCIVTNHEAGTVGGVYDIEKAYGKDPYEIFLSGALPLITIKNPNAESESELIIFRDSFGSSIAPLLAEAYSKITLVDIRYLRSDYLDRFINFEGQDVLFLFSTLILNNSETLN